MSNEITKIEPLNQLPTGIKAMSERDMRELMEFTKHLANAPYYQKMGPGGVLAIWLTAKEMGLPPMMCLNGGMYTFSGQVTLSAKVINLLLLRAGHRAEVLKLDDECCEIKFVRGDRRKDQGAEFVYKYTMEDAKRAGLLNKKNWQTNPRDMLYNRCLSGGAIKHMPDATNGAYVIGEMPGDGDIIDVIPEDVILPAEEKKPEVKPKKTCITIDQVNELNSLLDFLPKEYKEQINDFIKTSYKCVGLAGLTENQYKKLRETFVKKIESLKPVEAEEVKEIQPEEATA
jgi:hypothetical protein